MSAARWLSLALVVAGAAAGSMLDTYRVPDPVRAGGYYVIAADLHVHAFPGDGALPAWELTEEAARRGLHAIVISNHNQTTAERLGRRFRRAGLPLLIAAQEVTTPGFHLVAAGISRTVDWRLPELDLVNAIHAQGGVVIAAHPVGRYWRAGDAMLAVIDGAEVAHPLAHGRPAVRAELSAFFTRARTINPDIAPIGSSDFHMVAPLGLCRTFVFAESVTVEGVLEAIRAGRTVAEDKYGVLYGDPTLTLLLDRTAAIPVTPPARRLVLLSAAMVLMGLLALVVLR
ncbi:MAG TPA: CehA/McbA family metallohydrolase [Vicinamibacterales bacterium]|nr:CehA/McbA family metallohydrolase [Vicinamibacterales bacterium]